MMKLNAELTRRESEVAELLAWGAAKKEVADKLFISTRTVENTARNIYTKTGVQKATELCVWWFCTKCGVSPSLDPLKRAFIAVILLAVFLPRELTANGDVFRIGRRTTSTVRACRMARRENEDGTINYQDF
jgi:DNA-binding CsgD family transcriptional regulator